MRTNKAFTLVEVAVAITILGIALGIFVSLQTKLIDNFIYEKNYFRATLAAKYLMTFVELEKDPPEFSDNESDLVDNLRIKGYFDELDQNSTEKSYNNWKLVQKVSIVEDLQGSPMEDTMRKVELKVKWSDSERDVVSLLYFVHIDK